MNIITKILTVIIFASIMYCKPKEIPYKHAVIPNNMFGISFCKMQLIDIISSLQENKKIFKCYNTSLYNEIKYNGKREELEKITGIITDFFIGEGLDENTIIDVWYNYFPSDEEFIFSIKFKEEYYDTLLELLNKQLGAENSNVNFRGYGEISWSDDPKHNSCILHIILSKRQQYDDPAKAEKGVCYLEIRTRARHPHVH